MGAVQTLARRHSLAMAAMGHIYTAESTNTCSTILTTTFFVDSPFLFISPSSPLGPLFTPPYFSLLSTRLFHRSRHHAPFHHCPLDCRNARVRRPCTW